MTVVAPAPAMSAPANEAVEQFNWMYTGDGSTPPYGAPITTSCLSLLCTPTIVCPADTIINCNTSIDTAFTGVATASSECLDTVMIVFSDVTTPGTCTNQYLISRTWIAFNDCMMADTCV